MQEIGEKEFKDMLNNDMITPYNVYNLDIDYPQYFSVKNYIENQHDNIDREQKLNILFLDIETFTNNTNTPMDITRAQHPINAVTVYSTFDKTYHSHILLLNSNIAHFPVDDLQSLETEYHKILLENEYIEEDDKIKLYYFTYEKDLISHVWKIIHNIDPAVLSGWYSDQFDIPYMYYRSYNVFDQDENKVNQLMSKFGKIKTQKMGQSLIIKLPEYPILDLMYLYKPRDEGGLECFGPQ